MAELFDPYLKWLGIPKSQQPPHLYRLLGIEAFESDPEVISHAADQRMAHLRNFGTGKHAALSQKLLNEVASARVRLLNAEEKARYDAGLRNKATLGRAMPLAGGPPVIPPKPVPTAAPLPAHQPAAAPSIHLDPADSGVGLRSGHGHTQDSNRPPWVVPAAIGGGVLAVAVLVAGIWMFLGREEPRPDEQQARAPARNSDDPGEPPAIDPDGDAPAEVPVDEPSTGNRDISHPLGPGTEATSSPGAFEPPEISRPGESVPPTEADPPVIPPADPELEGSPPIEPVLEEPEPMPPRGLTPPPPMLPIDRRPPVPTDDVQAQARKDILEIYGEEMKRAKTVLDKAALFKEFAHEGQSEQNGPASRWVLLGMALDMAVETGDVDSVISVANSLIDSFQVDPHRTKADALARVSDVVVRFRGVLPANRQIVDLARGFSSEALRAGDVDAASRLLGAAVPAARKLGDRRLVIELQEESRQIDRLRSRVDLVELARKRLEVEPDNPKANLVAGMWDCFIEGHWEQGLPRLAKGDDPALAALAARDLANPTDPAEQFDLGKEYDDLAGKREGVEAERALGRAVDWYRRASRQIDGGLLRTRIDKRLQEIGESGAAGAAGEYALQFNGTGAHAVVANFAYTANTPITIEAIVKPQVQQAGAPGGGFVRSSYQTIFGNLNTGGIGVGRYSSGWFLRFYYQSSGAYTSLNSVYGSARINYDSWTHVAAVYNVREARLFVNGQLASTETASGLHVIGKMPFIIGGDPSGPGQISNLFCGQVRAIRVSNTVRYVQNFEPPTNLGVDPATVLLFPMNEGQGTQLVSSVGQRITAQINGAEWVKLE